MLSYHIPRRLNFRSVDFCKYVSFLIIRSRGKDLYVETMEEQKNVLLELMNCIMCIIQFIVGRIGNTRITRFTGIKHLHNVPYGGVFLDFQKYIIHFF